MGAMPYKDQSLQVAFQRKWKARRRAEWLKKKGGCVKCGSTKNLEVDHKSPAHKVDSHIWSWSGERLKAELAKCQVLCRSCHLKKTLRQRAAQGK